MNQEHPITENSLAKLLRAGYSIYRIPPAYKKAIHKLKFGKWGVKWDSFATYNSANEAEAALLDLLKDQKILQVK
jgi:hypothetical protein